MNSFNSPILNSLSSVVSQSGEIDWRALENFGFAPWFDKMRAIPQEYDYHGEGSVLNHVKMVVECMVTLPEYRECSDEEKLVLLLASLLHDMGKIKRTRVEEGKIVSPGHSSKGAVMAREFLWKDLGLAGSTEKQRIREAVCFLVRYHSFPPYAVKDEDAVLRMLKLVANQELTASFSARLLYILSKADVLGRICTDKKEQLEKVEFFRLLSEENNCLDSPFLFNDKYTLRAYFQGKTVWPSDSLYNSNWGEVILLSGLPGVGKDTYIATHYPDLPVVCLDNVRKKLGVLPTDPQGVVIATAQEEAKEYLRKKQSFVWNATNITSQIRQKQISLFERYNASVRTVFLETEWEEGLRRNSGREAVVPEVEIGKMLSKLEIPERFESESVEWKIN